MTWLRSFLASQSLVDTFLLVLGLCLLIVWSVFPTEKRFYRLLLIYAGFIFSTTLVAHLTLTWK